MARGPASVQLNTVRHPQPPVCSERTFRRGAAARSRLSKMKRWAWTIAAGPTYSSSAQKDGQDVVQAAHRMHLVVSSYRARSSGLCRRSRSGGGSSFTKKGKTDREGEKKGSMSTIRAFTSGRRGGGAGGGRR